MNIEILLFDGFDEFDAMAPWEVFAGLAQVTDRVRASFVTLDGAGPVRLRCGHVAHASRHVRAPARAGGGAAAYLSVGGKHLW